MKPKPSSDRSFGVVFAVVFAIIGLYPLRHGTDPRWWSLGIAAAFLAVALVRPARLNPLNRLWTRFGLLLNAIITPVIMGLLFWLAFVPTGLLMRLLGKRPLNLGFDDQCESYWITREQPGPTPESMKYQF